MDRLDPDWIAQVYEDPCLKVGQLRRVVPASELPVGSLEAFVENVLQPKFWLLLPSLPCPPPPALPMPLLCANWSQSLFLENRTRAS